MWAEGTCWACSICSDNNLFWRILISCHLLSFSLSEIKIDWQITGNDSRRNSQFAFSIVSNVLCEIFKHGGVSEPAGILATSILVSAMSSVFSKIGWSLVYQNVTGRFIFLCASRIILQRSSRARWGSNRVSLTRRTARIPLANRRWWRISGCSRPVQTLISLFDRHREWKLARNNHPARRRTRFHHPTRPSAVPRLEKSLNGGCL